MNAALETHTAFALRSKGTTTPQLARLRRAVPQAPIPGGIEALRHARCAGTDDGAKQDAVNSVAVGPSWRLDFSRRRS